MLQADIPSAMDELDEWLPRLLCSIIRGVFLTAGGKSPSHVNVGGQLATMTHLYAIMHMFNFLERDQILAANAEELMVKLYTMRPQPLVNVSTWPSMKVFWEQWYAGLFFDFQQDIEVISEDDPISVGQVVGYPTNVIDVGTQPLATYSARIRRLLTVVIYRVVYKVQLYLYNHTQRPSSNRKGLQRQAAPDSFQSGLPQPQQFS